VLAACGALVLLHMLIWLLLLLLLAPLRLAHLLPTCA
jgi:hypothetical protein